ncbi:SRPBCC family protein [Chryseolinea lacunae]|uniref:SRPBCC domain-containing protein n=1 Tax=Chryseolinea lacunae TaxID=2801331 RepID=A0ABS1L2Q9_9BACT|nr:SRPBCC domain-containing protein [Chryseolinea lacunae]MBL0745222.1 SRPBCC domain-containing protein [Chryseolinea lacunae]
MHSINHTFTFSHPPEAVWQFLTDPDLMAQWLMKNDFKPIVGHAFQFKTNPIPSLNIDGIMHCTVLEIVPFKKLSYTWKAGPGNGKIELDTLVVWTLRPIANGTELHLEHSGFRDPENHDIYKGMMNGWLTNLQKMANYINTTQHGTTHA